MVSNPYLSLHGSPLFLQVADCLRKSSARDGVEVGAAMGWVPQRCLANYCRPHHRRPPRVLACRMGDGASALTRRHCFRFARVVKPESGYTRQEGEDSSETGECSGPPTLSQHPRMAALHQEPSCSLAPSLLAARGLTPHPAAQIWHPAPESSIPHPASQI